MTILISCVVILASLLALASGVWVMTGLVTELLHPSNKRYNPADTEKPLSQKKAKTPEN